MSRYSLVPVVVAALTTVSFIPGLSGSFLNWDDNVNFLDNPAYRGLGREQIHWAFTSVLFGHYIPLTRLSWNLNYVTGGMDPWGYHLLNLLLHAANTILFYVVARRLLAAASSEGSQDGLGAPELAAAAAVAALVVGAHPPRGQPVRLFVGPAALPPLYEMRPRFSLLEPRFGLAMGATVVVTALLIVLRHGWPAGLAAWTFSALMLAPMSAAVRRGVDLAPDRYSYLAGM